MGDPGARLDGGALADRLTRVDDLLERVQQVPGPTAEAAIEAVRALTEVYGEALARVLDHAGDGLTGRLVQDDLLGHLLVLHGLHPEPVETRAARAVERVRPTVRERGGDVELAGIDGPVARVRLTASGCGAAAFEEAVREAVLAVAPELSDVVPVREAAFVPLGTLTTRLVTAEGPA
jgi:Fe-S cluster biogenesis protein NfuA